MKRARTGGRRRRRALGQHFLVSGPLPEQMVARFAPAAGEPVLEIGPGRGVLTRLLLAAGARVLAIEIDAALSARLERELDCERLLLVRGDALELDLPELLRRAFGQAPVRCLSSLPYSTGTAILERLCAAMPPLSEACVLLQEEVARRAAAAEGTPDYGFLSVRVQSRAAPRLGMRVRPGAFSPPPKVTSRLLWLAPHPSPPVGSEHLAAYLELAGRLFAHPRKTVLNNLRAAGYGEAALAAARAAGDLEARPGRWCPRRIAALLACLRGPALC
jgi:16S rRNA (adenine1518-N6/adenine1519-N6)-dimethyltransferase